MRAHAERFMGQKKHDPKIRIFLGRTLCGELYGFIFSCQVHSCVCLHDTVRPASCIHVGAAKS